jgi:hypothetical protein
MSNVVRPGSFCRPGDTGTTRTDTPMACTATKPGERARWRRAVNSDTPPPDGVPPEPTAAAPVTGLRSDQPLLPNGWGYNPNMPIHFHDDGEIGIAIKRMGDDAYIDVDGRPLGDVLGMLATDAVLDRSTSQEVLDKLKILRDRLPEGSAARHQLDMAIMALDAPDTPLPDAPDGTPEPLRQLMVDLHAVPLVRRDPRIEWDALWELMTEMAAGRLSSRGLARALQRLHNRRHESVEGKFDIDRAVARAVAALTNPARQAGQG